MRRYKGFLHFLNGSAHLKREEMKNKQLKEWVSELFQEVEKHKWNESQKTGGDVGWPYAASDWLNQHFEPWQKNNPVAKAKSRLRSSKAS
jgi:hypothetical protein